MPSWLTQMNYVVWLNASNGYDRDVLYDLASTMGLAARHQLPERCFERATGTATNNLRTFRLAHCERHAPHSTTSGTYRVAGIRPLMMSELSLPTESCTQRHEALA